MAYLYFSDGSPDAEEYESNYLYFNESNTAIVSEIERLLIRRKEDPTIINQLEELCRKSFETKGNRSNVFSAMKKNVFSYCKRISSSTNRKSTRGIRMKTALSQ
jgi:hypothetical protein